MIMAQQSMHPIEKVLIIALRPTFIGSDFIEKDNTLNIVICCKAFNYMEVQERIQMVYDIIDNSEVIEDRPTVIVQAYNQQELDELLETLL